MRVPAFGLAALLVLAGCDGGGDPVQQALRETAAANQSATVRDGEVSGATLSATTGDEAYVARMAAHHREAVAMANAALKDSRDPEIRRMAQAVVDTRAREIAEMQAWRPAPQSAER